MRDEESAASSKRVMPMVPPVAGRFGGAGDENESVPSPPDEWAPMLVGECVTFTGGGQPPKSTFVFSPRADYIRLIQIRDYKSNEFATYIPRSLATKWCTEQDIMIGRYGPPIFQILRGIEGAYNVALMKATPSSAIDNDYLFHFLQQDSLFRFVELLSRRSSGQTGVDLVALRQYKLPLPALPEQRAIAEALSDVDALLGALDRLIAKKRDLKQAAMQQLLTGQKRLPGFSQQWKSGRLGDVCSFRTGPFGSALHKSDYIDDGVPLVNPMHIADGAILPTRDMTITPSAARRLSEFLLKTGDVVIGRRGDMGRCAVVRPHQAGWLCGTGSLIVRCVGPAVPEFIQRILSSAEVVTAIENASVGSTMTNLNQGTLRQLRVVLPDVPEQVAIAEVLSSLDADLSTIEQRRDKTRAVKQGMMQELLTGRIRLV